MKNSFLFFASLLLVSWGTACNKKVAAVAETPPKLRPSVAEDTVRNDPGGDIATPDIAEEPAPEPEQEDEVIELWASLKKTACYGYCPVFEYKYYSDGRISYHGELHVERLGDYEAWADESFKIGLSQLAEQHQYFSFEEEYPTNGRKISDLPSTLTFLSIDGRKKNITNNHESPLKLRAFEKALQTLFEAQQWVKVGGGE